MSDHGDKCPICREVDRFEEEAEEAARRGLETVRAYLEKDTK